MSKFEPGVVLKERYKIVSLLGEGGMGEVYLANDLSLDTQVAIKVNHNLNDTASNQFIREARLLASLKHPNLPRVIDYFTENQYQVLVMDYIAGDDLRKIVERKQKLTHEQITRWAIELADALTYLHNRKPPIFHRDIKPANIKLTPSGDVILVDFGIAKTGDPSQETQTGAWAFSPGFAPPEQVSGMRTGPYTDQYALAATIYYLFAGKAPVDSAQRMMGTSQFVPLEMTAPNIPDHVNAAVNRALSMNPTERFATVADFIAAFTNSQPGADSQGQMTKVSPRKGATIPHVPSSNQAIPPAPKKKKGGLIAAILVIIIAALLVGGYYGLRSLGIINYGNVAETAAVYAAQTLAVIPTSTTAATVNETASPTAEITSTAEATTTPEATAAAAIKPIGHGGKVAFVSNRQEDGYNQIWLMDVGKDANGNIVASNPEQLTFSEGDKSQPNWSPDGTKLVFVGESKGFAPNGTPYAKDIYVLDLTQEKPEPVDITNYAGDDVDPAWSPTGKWIAYTSYYRDDGMPQIFLIDASNYSNKGNISDHFAEHYPTWTPNDDFLLYEMDYNNLKILSMHDRWSLYKNTVKFDMSSDAGRLGNVTDPQVSLDGSMIVYTRVVNNKSNLFTAVFKERGKVVTQLTNSDMDSAPCWSPDGKWVLFTSERDGDKEIYIIGVDGSKLTNLSNMPALDSDPAWQPIKQ